MKVENSLFFAQIVELGLLAGNLAVLLLNDTLHLLEVVIKHTHFFVYLWHVNVFQEVLDAEPEVRKLKLGHLSDHLGIFLVLRLQFSHLVIIRLENLSELRLILLKLR